MTRDEDHGSYRVNAPLIRPDAADTFSQRREVNGDHSEDPSSSDSGSIFVWALTLSASISGILFGYEYVHYCQLPMLRFQY